MSTSDRSGSPRDLDRVIRRGISATARHIEEHIANRALACCGLCVSVSFGLLGVLFFLLQTCDCVGP